MRKLLAAVLAVCVFVANAEAASLPPTNNSTNIAPTGSTGTLSIGDALAQAPNIMSFANVKCDGTTDDSAAIKAAHDVVAAAGKRFIYFPERTCNAPSLGKNGYQVGNVIFIGPGKLSGVYRKQVIPTTASAGLVGGEIAPTNLRQFASTKTPVIVVTGDSTSTYPNPQAAPPNLSSSLDITDRLLFDKIRRDNPDKNILQSNWYNRGIPGTAWSQLNGIVAGGTANVGSWYTGLGTTPWVTHICSVAPDLVFIKMGTNDSIGLTPSDMVSAINKIQACTAGKTADVVLITPTARSGMYATLNNPYDQNGRDAQAGLQRTYARMHNLGIIDFNRQGDLAVDGFDPEAVSMEDVITSATQPTVSFPYFLPEANIHDFDLTAQFDNTGGALFGSVNGYNNGGNRLQIKPIGGFASTNLQIFDFGNFLSISFVAGGGVANLAQVNNIVATPSGLFTVHVAVKGSEVIVEFTVGTTMYTAYAGYAPMWGGSVYSGANVNTPPTIMQTTGTISTSFKIFHLGLGRYKPFMPIVTDKECWGTEDQLYPYGGNGVNHETSICMNNVYKPLIERTSFAVPTPRSYSATGITAAGTSLATATPLTEDDSYVTTVASGTGVLLRGVATPQKITNSGANALSIYPPVSTAQLWKAGASLGAGTADTIAAGGHVTVTCPTIALCYEAP